MGELVVHYLIMILVTLGLFASPSVTASTDKSGETISLWTRKPGQYKNAEKSELQDEVTVDLSSLNPKKKKLFDIQYGKSYTFTTIPLKDVTDQYKKCSHCDLVLLHFSNGMLIPLPRDSAAWKSLNPRIAIAIDHASKKVNSKIFPEIAKKDERFKDPRPIQFQGNKIVVHELWHPLIPDPKASGFSPWKHVSSLAGIEFVEQDAYYGQFRVAKSLELNAGLQLFQNRCQYCHGIQKIGARFGWDYLQPVPIFRLKDANHVGNLVKYRYHDELERGLMMPEQSDVTTKQIEELWIWLKALAPEGVKKYQS